MKKIVFRSGPPKARLAGTSGVRMMPMLRAVGREHPGAARAGAKDPAVDIDLHAVGHAVGLLGRHVGKDAPPDHVAGGVELDRVDVLGMARIGDVEDALVGREGEPVRVFELGDEAVGPVGLDRDRPRNAASSLSASGMRSPGSVNQMLPSDRQTTSLGRLIRLP